MGEYVNRIYALHQIGNGINVGSFKVNDLPYICDIFGGFNEAEAVREQGN